MKLQSQAAVKQQQSVFYDFLQNLWGRNNSPFCAERLEWERIFSIFSVQHQHKDCVDRASAKHWPKKKNLAGVRILSPSDLMPNGRYAFTFAHYQINSIKHAVAISVLQRHRRHYLKSKSANVFPPVEQTQCLLYYSSQAGRQSVLCKATFCFSLFFSFTKVSPTTKEKCYVWVIITM